MDIWFQVSEENPGAITENLLNPNAAKLWLNAQAERALSHHTYHACFFLVNLFDKSLNFISLFWPKCLSGWSFTSIFYEHT